MQIFPNVQGQLTPQTFIIVLVTCKNEDDPIKSEGARVLTTLNIDFSNAQGQLTQ